MGERERSGRAEGVRYTLSQHRESTGKTTGELVPQKHGGALRNGGTNRGGPGRTPDEFKQRMAELVNRQAVGDYLEKCLMGEFGPKFFLSALQYVTDRGYGKAAQPIVGDSEQPVEIVVKYSK